MPYISHPCVLRFPCWQCACALQASCAWRNRHAAQVAGGACASLLWKQGGDGGSSRSKNPIAVPALRIYMEAPAANRQTAQVEANPQGAVPADNQPAAASAQSAKARVPPVPVPWAQEPARAGLAAAITAASLWGALKIPCDGVQLGRVVDRWCHIYLDPQVLVTMEVERAFGAMSQRVVTKHVSQCTTDRATCLLAGRTFAMQHTGRSVKLSDIRAARHRRWQRLAQDREKLQQLGTRDTAGVVQALLAATAVAAANQHSSKTAGSSRGGHARAHLRMAKGLTCGSTGESSRV